MRAKQMILTMTTAFMLLFSSCSPLPSQLSAADDPTLGSSLAYTDPDIDTVIDDDPDRSADIPILLPDNSLSTEDWKKDLPPYSGDPSILIHNGIPFFTSGELLTIPFEQYPELDSLGRCGPAFASVCRETMPTEERGSIGNVKPTGWHTVKYDVISDLYLYNRCHLIGYQLSGENANEKNLITGTRYLNIEGMLPWEDMVASYVEETGNHVAYRVTPYFMGDDLVASGVLMEAYSVEDQGTGICFNVYCYNVQPGILIDYSTGESILDETWTPTEAAKEDTDQGYDYVLNTNTMRFHFPECPSVQDMSDKNKRYFSGDREMLIGEGYVPCGRCTP